MQISIRVKLAQVAYLPRLCISLISCESSTSPNSSKMEISDCCAQLEFHSVMLYDDGGQKNE